MKRLITICVVFAALTVFSGGSLDAHELDHRLVGFLPQKIGFTNFVYPSASSDNLLSLRALAVEHKAILVTFFAAWCENSQHDAKTVAHLLDKYGNRGLAVVGVCEYSSKAEIAAFLKKRKPAYPIGVESWSEDDRQKSAHYNYRKAAGDERKWGTPFTVLIETRNIRASGNLLTDELYTANGEIDRKNAEKLLDGILKK